MTNTVTRFNLFDRPANEAEGLDEREVVRLFHKRSLLMSIDMEDVTRYGDDPSSGFDVADLDAFINREPRTVEQVMDYLGEEALEEGEDDEAEEGGSIVPAKYRIRYGAPQNCGDEIALALTAFVTLPRVTKGDADGGLDRAKLRAVAETNDIGDRLAVWEDHGLNGGLLRMNTSNVLRGMWRRGEEVTVGDKTWPAREVEKKARAKKAPKAKVAKSK